MTDNLSALKSFDPFKSGFDENTIINASAGKSGDGSISVTAKGRYKLFSFWNRTPAQKAENNAARAQLLTALGKAFNMEGVHNEQGRVTFSRDFLNKLEEKLGKDVLKTGDFKLDNQGNVASGKPLTARRVRQILNKAYTMVSKAPEKIDYDKYADKLENIKASYENNLRMSENLKLVDNCLKALKNSAEKNETIIMKNDNCEGIDPKDQDCLFVYRQGDDGDLAAVENPYHFKSIFQGTAGFPSDSEDKFTLYLRKGDYDPGKPNEKIDKMAQKYHGGVKPPAYDFRDDMIRELNDKLIKYVRMTVDLFEKCSEKGKLDDFEQVMSTVNMGPKTTVTNKIAELKALERRLL
ncbi:hypothetical protein [Succinimonas sp.]|uniref:hypothetical protein n=1 Tax=Succinimonas sp. TaxID=1936151 RepID=UPI00386E8923